MSEIYNKYEGSVHTPYSEIGKDDNTDPDIWGNVEYRGRKFNMYSDPGFISELFTESIVAGNPNKSQFLTIADFGGSEGFVVDLVSKQLEAKGYVVRPLNVDINTDALNSGKMKHPNVQGIESHLTQLPLVENSVDAGLCRFVLQYMNKEEQGRFIQEAFRVLKPNGKLRIVVPATLDSVAEKPYYELYNDVAAAMIGEDPEKVKQSRYTPSGHEVAEMGKSAGFSVGQQIEYTDQVRMWISPESFASRFKIDPEILMPVFRKHKESGQLIFSEKPGSLQTRAPLCLIELVHES